MTQKKAYIIAQIKVHDEEAMQEYIRLAAIARSQYQIEFLVRGDHYEVLEGVDLFEEPRRISILAFQSMADAKSFYYSEAYQTAKVVRQAAADSHIILVEGM
jgi:uncharacterized protein (DUF1330 family)